MEQKKKSYVMLFGMAVAARQYGAAAVFAQQAGTNICSKLEAIRKSLHSADICCHVISHREKREHAQTESIVTSEATANTTILMCAVKAAKKIFSKMPPMPLRNCKRKYRPGSAWRSGCRMPLPAPPKEN